MIASPTAKLKIEKPIKCFFVLVLATIVLIPPATYSDESVILGWVEKTKIMDLGVTTKMKRAG